MVHTSFTRKVNRYHGKKAFSYVVKPSRRGRQEAARAIEKRVMLRSIDRGHWTNVLTLINVNKFSLRDFLALLLCLDLSFLGPLLLAPRHTSFISSHSQRAATRKNTRWLHFPPNQWCHHFTFQHSFFFVSLDYSSSLLAIAFVARDSCQNQSLLCLLHKHHFLTWRDLTLPAWHHVVVICKETSFH